MSDDQIGDAREKLIRENMAKSKTHEFRDCWENCDDETECPHDKYLPVLGLNSEAIEYLLGVIDRLRGEKEGTGDG